ncbi:MAG: hypothetical protein ACRDID_01345, partial [Ktedonobacterales bacterium]
VARRSCDIIVMRLWPYVRRARSMERAVPPSPQIGESEAAPMETRPDLFTTHDSPSRATCATCPLRVAMERIAQVALRQHVLYLEGECQPRVELLRELEASYTLERLIRMRICAVSRSSALPAGELALAVDTLRCQDLNSALSACAMASDCPLSA